MKKITKIFAIICVTLLAAQVLLVITSWVITAAQPNIEMRSLLMPEGIRWFIGNYAGCLASVIIVWIILLGAAVGIIRYSGFWQSIRDIMHLNVRERLAMRLVVVELIFFVAAIVLMTCSPHALLLSITGHISPSSFSTGLIPMIAFIACVTAASFGLASGRLHTITDVFVAMTRGIAGSAPLLLLYVFAAQLYYSIRYVFG